MKKIFNITVIYTAFILRGFSFLILAPIFTKVMQKDTWGGVLSAQSLFLWLALLLEYGFALSFSRKVSSTSDLNERSRLFNAVLSAKIILILPAIFIVFLFTRFGILKDYSNLAWLSLVACIAQSLAPLWYYQAIEKIAIFSLMDVVSRLMYILISIKFITRDSDSGNIFVFQTIAFILLAFMAIVYLTRHGLKVKFDLSSGLYAIRDGFNLASYTMITGLYSSLSIIIFGIFATPHLVATYGSGDRVVRAGLGLMGPINQIILPRSARAFAISFENGLKEFRKIASIYVSLSLLLMLLVYFSADLAIRILFGEVYVASAEVVRIMSILFPLIALNTIITYHFLIPNQLDSKVTQIYIFVSIVSVISMVLTIPLYRIEGMVFSVILPELLALILGSILVAKRIKLYRRISNG